MKWRDPDSGRGRAAVRTAERQHNGVEAGTARGFSGSDSGSGFTQPFSKGGGDTMRTGWRWVTGDGHAAGNFIRDPAGSDRPPPWYDLSPCRPFPALEPLPQRQPIPLEIRAELQRFGIRLGGSIPYA